MLRFYVLLACFRFSLAQIIIILMNKTWSLAKIANRNISVLTDFIKRLFLKIHFQKLLSLCVFY